MKLFSEKFLNNNESKKPFITDNISRKKILGEGWTGIVYEVDIEKNKHHKQFALKDFTKNGNESAKYSAEKEYRSYLEAKKAGLKVFPTVRLNKNHKELLMTLGTNDHFLLFNARDSDRWSKVDKIDNLQNLLFEMKENAKKGADFGLDIIWDSYFFIINKIKPTEVNFVIGDFGNVKISNETKEDLYYKNIHEVEKALESFLDHYIKYDKKLLYKEKINDILISNQDSCSYPEVN